MERSVRVAIRASSSMSLRPAKIPRCAATLTPMCRCLHNTSHKDATPIAHPTVLMPPPDAPQASVAFSHDRVSRKKQQAELLENSSKARVNPAKPQSALQKRFWKDVSVQETEEGLQILLDKRPVRTASRNILTLPHNKRALATSIALEWDQLVSAQQALKQHYIPLTSLTARAIDIEAADRAGDTTIRKAIVNMVMRYVATDTLLCWAPEKNLHEPEQKGKPTLRQRQRESAEPIIAYLQTHIFPGVEIQPILGEDSIMPARQPEMTREVIRGWTSGLSAYELAALERGVLATKSLLVSARLLVEWSRSYQHLRQFTKPERGFGIEEAAHAATLEVLHQIEQWGEVEDTHDVEREDVRRQLGSMLLLLVE